MTTKRRVLDALNRMLAPTGFSLQRRRNHRSVVDAAHPMTRALCHLASFALEPLALVDAGCSGGLDERWRIFDRQLRAWGIDAMSAECARLRAAERNPGVRYIDARLDMALVPAALPCNNPWPRTSTAAALAKQEHAHRGGANAVRDNQWQEQDLSRRTLTVDALLEAEGIDAMDFLKIDLDGPDFDILSGFAPHLGRLQTLGVQLEVNFFGTAANNVHTFHNSDRLMRAHGFEFFGLTPYRYSTAALPAAFTAGVLGPTAFGRVIQGDALYFRDPAGETGVCTLSAVKLLKLACLFELFDMPDCAAEILLNFRDLIGRQDTDRLLDLLVPHLDGNKISYADYMARFRADPRGFL
jgi:hypothetical protein